MYEPRWMFPSDDEEEKCPDCGSIMWACFVPTEPEIIGKAAKAHGRRGDIEKRCKACHEKK